MKRVCCLYRVSTKKQVDKNENDIPMQKIVCHNFCARQHDWEIVREFSEKGVSGYKVSAVDRDAIQELKDMAQNNEFDILLVFMFDRIGRIDDETPFVVEWFVKHDIEVWSTQEGQQRFDSHVDKLMNYLRFWQASGESEKTSIRIKNSFQQMEEAGLYTGGHIKFGYRLVNSGLVNKKNQPIKKYEIDLEEAEIIHIIDDFTVNKGYGSHRLSNYLNEHGYKMRGAKFTRMKICRILNDIFYCGKLPDGRSTEATEKLRIRSDETYEQILYILGQRKMTDQGKRHIAYETKGKTMLSGNVFCAHCGGRLIAAHYTDKHTRQDGTVRISETVKYKCYHKSRKLCECDGQTTYRAEVIDNIVSEIICDIFGCMDGAPEEDKLQILLKRKMEGNKATQKKLTFEIEKNRERLKKLQIELGKSLTGDSVFEYADIKEYIKLTNELLSEQQEQLLKLQEEEKSQTKSVAAIIPAYKRFKSWAEEFKNASLEQKKMIAGQLFTKIEVGRDYKINVELNMTYQQFCTEWLNGILSRKAG